MVPKVSYDTALKATGMRGGISTQVHILLKRLFTSTRDPSEPRLDFMITTARLD
jgi:hypothetical protein